MGFRMALRYDGVRYEDDIFPLFGPFLLSFLLPVNKEPSLALFNISIIFNNPKFGCFFVRQDCTGS